MGIAAVVLGEPNAAYMKKIQAHMLESKKVVGEQMRKNEEAKQRAEQGRKIAELMKKRADEKFQKEMEERAEKAKAAEAAAAAGEEAPKEEEKKEEEKEEEKKEEGDVKMEEVKKEEVDDEMEELRK